MLTAKIVLAVGIWTLVLAEWLARETPMSLAAAASTVARVTVWLGFAGLTSVLVLIYRRTRDPHILGGLALAGAVTLTMGWYIVASVGWSTGWWRQAFFWEHAWVVWYPAAVVVVRLIVASWVRER